MNTIERIQKQIRENPILLYMKGTPDNPECRYSKRILSVLNNYDVGFAYVNILQDPDIRAELPIYANWPTFPQLWINGELIGGCDILVEMHEEQTLAALLEQTKPKE